MDDLNGARIVVLGGSGELGSRLVERMVAEGAAVLAVGRRDERLSALAAETGASVLVADIGHPDSARAIVTAAVEELGGIDGLINAAGVVAFGELAATDDATLDEIIATDLVGPLRVIREATGVMDGGFVLAITGVVAEQPPAGMVAYSAAKAGLSAASKALSRELRRRGIQVLDARPPHTETGLATRPIAGTAPQLPDGLDPDAVADRIVDAIKQKRRELPAAEFG